MARRLRRRLASSSDDEDNAATRTRSLKRLKKASEGGEQEEQEGRQRHNLRPRREKNSARAIRERMQTAREARRHRSQSSELAEVDEPDLQDVEEDDESEESFIVSDGEADIEDEPEAAELSEKESESDDGSQEPPSHRALINQQMNEALFSPSRKNLSIEDAFSVFYEFLLKCCVQPTYAQICFRDASKQGMDTVAALSKVEKYISDRKNSWVRSGCWSQQVVSEFCTFSFLDSKPCAFNNGCDVCNRNRVSSVVLTLRGPKYDSNLSSAIRISQPLLLASSGPRSLSSGCFCSDRAILFHRLQHYSAHTLVALKARFDRMTRQTGSLVEAKEHMQGLESEFFTVFQELVDLSERYTESGNRFIEISFSNTLTASLPSLAELEKYLPFFFPSPEPDNNCQDHKGNNCQDHKDNNCQDQKPEEGRNIEEVQDIDDVISAFKKRSSRVKVLQSLGGLISSVEELRALLRDLPASLRNELRSLLAQSPVRAVDPSQSPMRSPVRAVDPSQSPVRSPVRVVDLSQSPVQNAVRVGQSRSPAPSATAIVVEVDHSSPSVDMDETLSAPPSPLVDADDTVSEAPSPVAVVAGKPEKRSSKQSSILQFFNRKC